MSDPTAGDHSAHAPQPSHSGGITGWLMLSLLVILIDQASKWAILQTFSEGERLNILPNLFDLTLWYNTGAAFSFLANHDGWQRWFFTIIGLCASAFIIYLLRQSAGQRLFAFGLAMILGGAIGNVIDRLVHGKVVDFLLFYIEPYFFPAFNAADSAITLGAICLILDELLRWRRSRRVATS